MDFTITTSKEQEVVDITDNIRALVKESGVKEGICHVFVTHATAAITINENADPNVSVDFLNILDKIVPKGAGYLHDRIDGNAHSHIKAAIIGPSETILIRKGDVVLGTWQDIFLCEFDGPKKRKVLVQVISK